MTPRLTDEEEITLNTYNSQAKHWTAIHSTEGFWSQEIQEFSKFLPKGKILEIGSGSGRDAKEFISRGYQYLGTDISSGLIQQARKNNIGAEFKVISIYNLDFDREFDGFWCTNVLLHIPRNRVNHAIQAIHRSLKTGGYGFISLKKGDGEQMEVDDRLKGKERYFVYWQSQEFSEILRLNGFKIIKEGKKLMGKRPDLLTYIVKVI